VRGDLASVREVRAGTGQRGSRVTRRRAAHPARWPRPLIVVVVVAVGGLSLAALIGDLTSNSTPGAAPPPGGTTRRPPGAPAAQTGASKVTTSTAMATGRSTSPPTSSSAPVVPPAPATAALRAGVPSDVPMPDPRFTPGAIQSSDTAAICTPGWASAHRDVSWATEDAVATEYGLSSHHGYEIDHLVPLELGGANSMANLWPEPYNSPYGAIEKDGLEDWLHQQVCFGDLALATAQHDIATNWYATWVAAGRPMPDWFGYSDSPPGGSTTTSPTTTTTTTTSVPATTAPPPAGSGGGAGGGGGGGGGGSGPWCQVSASSAGNPQYPEDYDVHITSNQPDTQAWASNGHNSYPGTTDGSGSVTILLYFTQPGDTVTVKVGAASCSTTA
jgi:hypothetical protein